MTRDELFEQAARALRDVGEGCQSGCVYVMPGQAARAVVALVLKAAAEVARERAVWVGDYQEEIADAILALCPPE